MIVSCAAAFMIWLSKFEHGNCCWHTGTYGWFMKLEDQPLSGWYSFDKNTSINFGDNIEYKKGDTNYFTVTTDKNFLKDSKIADTILKQTRCKLDNKNYYLYETIKKNDG